MKSDYGRSIELACPTCASFSFSELGEVEGVKTYECARCGYCGTYDSIVAGNGERIDAGVTEMKREIISDIEAEFSRAFKNWK